MSNEIYQEQECTCSARFRSDDALNVHLEEYRSRERYYSIEAEICRTHAKASDDDDQGGSGHGKYNEDGESAPETGKKLRKSRLCPHPSCLGQPEYGSRLSLRRHFLHHIEGVEVCVGCHELFRLPSQFVRHIEQRNDEQHNNLCKRKAAYIRESCQDLRDRADEELDAWEKGKKRPLASIGTRPARRAKLDRPEVTIADSFPIQDDNGAPYPTQLDAPLVSIPDGSAHSTENFTIPQAPYFTSMDGTATILGNIEIAPIIRTLNFPPWNIRDLGGETVAYHEQ